MASPLVDDEMVRTESSRVPLVETVTADGESPNGVRRVAGPRVGPDGVPRLMPYALLAVSLLATAAAPVWGPARWGMGPVLALGALAAVHRWWGDRRAGSVGWLAGQLVLITALVVLAPFACIYAFSGYFDVQRILRAPARTPTMVAVAAVVAFGQVGGVVGVRDVPWLYGVLLLVNAGLAPLMGHLAQQREDDILRREEAVLALEAEQRRTASLQQQLLDQARDAGILDERARLSREIHDTVAQGLIAIITQLEAIGDEDDAASWQPRVRRASGVARDSLAEARRAIHALGSPALETASVPDALQTVVRRWSEASEIDGFVVVEGQARPTRSDETLLRVVQEGLANAARHSGAHRVAVTLTYADDVRLDVRDDGCGFDLSAVRPGTGLIGMRARVQEAGGTLVLESEPGEGCAISVAVPG